MTKELTLAVFRDRIATRIEGLDTNYVGQEGRGAARDMKAKALVIVRTQPVIGDDAELDDALEATLRDWLAGHGEFELDDRLVDAAKAWLEAQAAGR